MRDTWGTRANGENLSKKQFMVNWVDANLAAGGSVFIQPRG